MMILMELGGSGRLASRKETVMPEKKYIVDLTSEEHDQLMALIHKGTLSARQLTRSHILLHAAEGASDGAIAAALHCGRATVERTRQRFVEEGLTAALTERPRPGKPRKLDGKQEALLVALACSDPPENRPTWTRQLLADRLVQLEVVEAISNEPVRTPLQRGTSNHG
jgi:transposase